MKRGARPSGERARGTVESELSGRWGARGAIGLVVAWFGVDGCGDEDWIGV